MAEIDPDAERFVEEPPKDTRSLAVEAERSPYQRDRARVLHCAAFRRLAAKTQVHTVGEGGGSSRVAPGAGTFVADDFLRTRLTHSLEVAQIGREMGARLGCDPDVVDTACLAHDLGHPPFGHNGEQALDEVARAAGGFEGNAQTLRVLTRLEAKVVGPDGASAGLNLTRAALDACSKYPWFRAAGQRKFGVYADDAPVFAWLREGAPELGRRCLEAQVMDWSDDVAYSVHDVEDGIHGGYVRLGPLRADAGERAALCADVAALYSGESPSDLAAVLDELLEDPVLAPLYHYDGTHRSLVALKHVTSVLTGRLTAAALAATRAKFGPEPLRRHEADLIVPRRTRAECALLKGLALRYVMRPRAAESWYEQQREILISLVHALTVRAPAALDRVFGPLWLAAPDDRARLRVVVDQVASLTDPAAVAWYQRLVGR
jgi:dGTPase